MLRPGYKAPSHIDIGGELLEEVHDKITEKMNTELEGKDLTMMQDGWSDVHNTPAIATTIHCKEKSFVLSAIETGANKKTASYCTTVALMQ